VWAGKPEASENCESDGSVSSYSDSNLVSPTRISEKTKLESNR